MTTHHNNIEIPIIIFRTGEDLQTRTYTGPFWAFSFFFFFCFFFFSTLLSVMGNPAKKAMKISTWKYIIFISWWQQQILSSWVCIKSIKTDILSIVTWQVPSPVPITCTSHEKENIPLHNQYLMDDAWQHLSWVSDY